MDRAKRAELTLNVKAIATAQTAYESGNDEYLDIPDFYPRTTVDKQQVQWQRGTPFELLGWSPDGLVRGMYKAERDGDYGFVATGECDVDGNSQNASYVITFDSRNIQPLTEGWMTPDTVY